jgi:hypothetical protein
MRTSLGRVFVLALGACAPGIPGRVVVAGSKDQPVAQPQPGNPPPDLAVPEGGWAQRVPHPDVLKMGVSGLARARRWGRPYCPKNGCWWNAAAL